MIQHHAKPGCTVIVGKSGTGKTTFALRYLVARQDFACRFVFEGPKLDLHERLRLPLARSLDDLALAQEDGFVVFDRSAMFPGDMVGGLDWFCRWSYEAAASMPGRKILLVDEVWKYCSPNSIPQSLAMWVCDGRKLGMETAFCTQQPNKLNGAITNEATELVCFRLQEQNALDRVADLGANRAEIARLPLGSFVSLNCETQGEIRGRLW